MATRAEKRWLPLEANPEVMNEFSRQLGLPPSVGFHDVFGLDPELLAMIPRPVLAVLLLFPLSPKESESEAAAEASSGPGATAFFMKQTIANACGTIGLLHAIGNTATPIALAQDSFLDQFFKATASMTPAERGRHLEESAEVEVAHSSAASAGDTRPPSLDEDTNLHFIAFSLSDGVLVELDGRKAGPVPHGASTPDTLLEDVVRVVKEFMSRNPDSLQFNLIALCGQP